MSFCAKWCLCNSQDLTYSVLDLLNACAADTVMTHLAKKPLYSRTAAQGDD